MKISRFFILCFLVIFSCDLALKPNSQDSIARVNSSFLTLDDIDTALFEGLSQQDSLIQIQNVINNWATEQLLQDGARINLEAEQQIEFEILVQQYKSDLYTSAYLEALVKQNLDTTITNQELEEVYNQNKELFVLKEDLIKLRYINHDKNLPNSNEIKRRFRRYNAEDRTVLDTISLQFNSFFLNDSVWIKSSQVISKIKPLKKGFNKVLLKKINFIQLKDSLGLYLMEVKDLLEIGSQAPMAYALPTLKQIIINKRKLKLVNQLKSEIVDDAIKNKKFEIYE
tara:strand:- start:1184 stop:2035 length:852 start_codon:yes stop_codon:yes gene_type:complete